METCWCRHVLRNYLIFLINIYFNYFLEERWRRVLKLEKTWKRNPIITLQLFDLLNSWSKYVHHGFHPLTSWNDNPRHSQMPFPSYFYFLNCMLSEVAEGNYCPIVPICATNSWHPQSPSTSQSWLIMAFKKYIYNLYKSVDA